MEVILRESIPSLGKAGEIVKVADGYARNYLLPQGKAILSDKKNLASLERQRKKILEIAAKQRQEAEALARQLEELEISIPVRVGENEKLYGSVTSQDIVKAVAQQGYTVDKRKVLLPEPIKTLGEFEVPVRLDVDVTAQLKVKVVAAE